MKRSPYPEKKRTFLADDFTSDAIEWRFSCGSWTEKDVRFIVSSLRNAEVISKASDALLGELADFYLEIARSGVAETQEITAIRTAANNLAAALRMGRGKQ